MWWNWIYKIVRGEKTTMNFEESFKQVVGTLFYWLDKIWFGEDAYNKEYWQS